MHHTPGSTAQLPTQSAMGTNGTQSRRRYVAPCFVIMCVSLVLLVISQRELNSDTLKIAKQAVMQSKLSEQNGAVTAALKKKTNVVGINAMVKTTPTTVVPVSRPCVGNQPEDGHRFMEVVEDVFVYSAFLDERDNDVDAKDGTITHAHAVRVMAIMRSPLNKLQPTLYCVGLITPGHYWSVRLKIHVTHFSLDRRYVPHILTCHLPRGLWRTPPCSVLISPSAMPKDTSKWIKVHAPAKTFQHNIEICVPPLFGNISHTDVIEFIEVVRLFGAERIHFYTYQVSHSVEAVLSYYEKLGSVTVLPWKLDKRLTSSKKAMHYYGQGTNIQDCLYRHMFSTRFLAFMDIDEVFVPANHSSWFSMMTSVKNYKQLAGIIVPSAFFDPIWRHKGYSSGRVRIRQLTDVIRTKQPVPHRAKCIVNPRHVFEKAIHSIGTPILKSLKGVRMPAELVLLHHYRVCLIGRAVCTNRVTDTAMLAYASKLQTHVEKAIAKLKL